MNLLVDLRADLAGWCVDAGTVGLATRPTRVAHTVSLRLVAHVHGCAVVRRRRLREEVVLIARRLEVLVLMLSGSRYVLSSRDLNLDIGSVCRLLAHVLLLARRTVEVLRRLIHDLVRRRGAHGQIHMLRRAAARRARPPLRCVMPVPLHTFNQLASLWIDFGERIYRIICSVASLSCVSIARNSTLDQGTVARAAFRGVRRASGLVLQVDLSTTAVVHVGARRVQSWSWLIEPTVDC